MRAGRVWSASLAERPQSNGSEVSVRRILSFGVAVLTLIVGTGSWASAQTTYHLHRESSTTSGLFQVRTVGPDASSLTI